MPVMAQFLDREAAVSAVLDSELSDEIPILTTPRRSLPNIRRKKPVQGNNRVFANSSSENEDECNDNLHTTGTLSSNDGDGGENVSMLQTCTARIILF